MQRETDQAYWWKEALRYWFVTHTQVPLMTLGKWKSILVKGDTDLSSSPELMTLEIWKNKTQDAYNLCTTDCRLQISKREWVKFNLPKKSEKQSLTFKTDHPKYKFEWENLAQPLKKLKTDSSQPETGEIARISLMMFKKRLRWVRRSKTHLTVIHLYPASELVVKNKQRVGSIKHTKRASSMKHTKGNHF